MIILTKKYRLIWSEKDILQDPFMEFSNCKTIVNSDTCFESDNINEIENKIDELDLIYNSGNNGGFIDIE